ncbi:MAG: hypothetical protein QM572_08405, partial [Nocardioides sp.]|uniref:hypothetical protein n=1 Tax=Nocardioides sp. TaxID=35761 RepID=UPI0039E55189
MSTAASWTRSQVRAAADVGHLLRFRTTTRGRRRFAAGLAVFVAITVAVAVAPAYLPGAGGGGYAFSVLLLVPSAMAGFLLLAVVAAVASGGGRELVARDQLVAYPVSPTTDHLGALLLAPLNIGWLIQSWALLGSAAFAVGRDDVGPLAVALLAWIAASTAIGQLVAWTVEWVRRLPGGLVAVRVVAVLGLLGAALLQLTHRLAPALDHVPTRRLLALYLDGAWTWRWLLGVVVTLAAFAVATCLGAAPATLAAHRPAREETAAESSHVR